MDDDDGGVRQWRSSFDDGDGIGEVLMIVEVGGILAALV